MNTFDVIERIVSCNPDIKYLRLVTYQSQKDLASDYATLWTSDDETVYHKALQLREKYNLPFWNALMLSIINKTSVEIPHNCLLGTSRHHDIEQYSLIKASNLDGEKHLIERSERIGINSHVIMENGYEAHIPMLDFHIPISERNILVVKEVCGILGLKGYILVSGNSFHFIGIKTFDKQDMINYLGRALLFTPIVDMTWIAHQLQEQSCTLRIVKKHDILPYVIAEV